MGFKGAKTLTCYKQRKPLELPRPIEVAPEKLCVVGSEAKVVHYFTLTVIDTLRLLAPKRSRPIHAVVSSPPNV